MIRTPTLAPTVTPRLCPMLATARVWLALGTVLLLLVPSLRGTHALIGWLPFWLVGAPVATLVSLRMLREPGWPFLAIRRAWTLRRRRQAVRL